MSPWIVRFKRQLAVMSVILFLIVAWEVYRAKRENYTKLWRQVRHLQLGLCVDVPQEDCKPSIGQSCQCD